MSTGLRETTAATMVEAYKTGAAYWTRNKPEGATFESLMALARSCGWHGHDNSAWLAGFYVTKYRGETLPMSEEFAAEYLRQIAQ